MKRIAICVVWMVCLASHGAWLEWYREDRYQGLDLTEGYRVLVGTNSGVYVVTNDVGLTNSVSLLRLHVFPVLTNYFVVTAYDWARRETPWSEEAFWGRATLSVAAPRTNVVLRVPSGKFYVERADTTSAWLAMNVVNGPTNIAFPTSGTMGFYRYRPYFVSASNPKSGKFVPMKAAFKANKKPMPVEATMRIVPGSVNLDPSKR